MKQIQVDIMADSSEIVHYDIPNIPIYIKKGLLSYYPDKRAVCHWHDDFEVILVLSGNMNYYINGQTLLLESGDGIFINSREMHYGYSSDTEDCEFICILFHPSLLAANRILFKEYLSQFLMTSNISYLKLEHKKHDYAIKCIFEIYENKRVHDSFYEFNVIGLIYSFMAEILRISNTYTQIDYQPASNDVLLLRKMVSFIHENYKNTVTLNDISASANIGKSKCCNLFQSHVHQTPFEFLNLYRLKKSAELLENTDLPITIIAMDCGFNHASYYSKLFLRYYHCTPSKYRDNI